MEHIEGNLLLVILMWYFWIGSLTFIVVLIRSFYNRIVDLIRSYEMFSGTRVYSNRPIYTIIIVFLVESVIEALFYSIFWGIVLLGYIVKGLIRKVKRR